MDSNRSKWILIAAGGVLLVTMLLIAAFSLGVYVGEHGWTRDGLQYAGGQAVGPGGQNRPGAGGLAQPGQSPQAGTQTGPGQIPAGLPPGRPQLTGRIVSVTDNQIELATPDGRRSLTLTPDTRVQDEQGQTLALSELQPGDVLAIFGNFVQGDGGMLQANLLVRLPPR